MQFILKGIRQTSSGLSVTRQYLKMQPLVAHASENIIEQPTKMRKLETPTLRVKKLSEHAILPTRGSSGAAGYDLAR